MCWRLMKRLDVIVNDDIFHGVVSRPRWIVRRRVKDIF